ncbi:hypothetical protein Acr_09g0005660 [Actinidia rufa]|uniref:Uncharacterized protein n=1 Tax=Actinidia rufa TaxID=165716 RepID=A0A7J0F618_9ERIC|nr:hypothetical protein Acr_09g0005660 [Actinidia rufa]
MTTHFKIYTFDPPKSFHFIIPSETQFHNSLPQQSQNCDFHQRPTAMDEASEKIENLKSLNSVLIKEAVERRQKVDSLQKSIGSLESALTRSKSEHRVTGRVDSAAGLYGGVGTREGSIHVSRERDDLRVELDVQIEETNGLRLKLVEAERRERKTEKKVQKMKVEYNGVMEERERRIELMARDKVGEGDTAGTRVSHFGHGRDTAGTRVSYFGHAGGHGWDTRVLFLG